MSRGTEAMVSLAKLVQTEGHPWAIIPEVLAGLASMKPRAFDLAEFEIEFEASMEADELEAQRRKRSELHSKGDVAVIPLKGVLRPQVSLLALLFGMGSGLNRFRDNLTQAAADDDIGAIIMDVDSPGGLTDQIPETAALIRGAREKKPVIAVANTLAASAAYWLASQADEVVVTPSGEVGSIGVYMEHADISASLEAQGIKPTLISAGKYKIEGNPYEALDDDALEFMQQGVDDMYDLFVSDVARGRDASVTEVRNGYGEGRVLTAKRAVSAKLADRIDTLDATISRVAGKPGRRPSRQEEPAELESFAKAPSSEELKRVHDALFA